MNIKRLQKEFKNFNEISPEHFRGELFGGDYYTWIVTIIGPSETAYSG